MLLTVSPVPLTATASDKHVLTATTYSKSVLRAVAGELYDRYADIDYFPSYEIVASPWSRGFFYESNMRSVNAGGVSVVMQTFLGEHDTATAADAVTVRRTRRVASGVEGAAVEKSADPAAEGGKSERRVRRRTRRGMKLKTAEAGLTAEEAVCEEILLDAFSR